MAAVFSLVISRVTALVPPGIKSAPDSGTRNDPKQIC